MSTMNDEDPQPPETMSFPALSPPSLPYDVVLNCVARVPRCYHPNLTLVSRSFRSLLASRELYSTRSFLGRTEHCLYICIRVPPEQTSVWFTLNQRPNSSGRIFVPVSSPPHSPHAIASTTIVAVGSEIYVIGGPVDDGWPTSNVLVLDCRYQMWRHAPNMHVARKYATAVVVDGKIYVMGGVGERSVNWGELFDPETQTWEPLQCPNGELQENQICKTAVMEGKVYVTTLGKRVVYDPKEGRWSEMEKVLEWGWTGLSWCVIENVMYCYDNSKLIWYDSKEGAWGEVMGMEVLLRRICGYARVAISNYGGSLVVLWDSKSGDRNKKIWCAEITLERRKGWQIWGKIEWFDDVLTVPKTYEFLEVVSVTL